MQPMLRRLVLVVLLFVVTVDLAAATDYCKCADKDNKKFDKSYKEGTAEKRDLTEKTPCKTRVCPGQANYSDNLVVCTKDNACDKHSCSGCPPLPCSFIGGTCVSTCAKCTSHCKGVAAKGKVPFVDPDQCKIKDKADCPDKKVCCVATPPTCKQVFGDKGECKKTCDSDACFDIAKAMQPPSMMAFTKETFLKGFCQETQCYAPSLGTCPSDQICCVYNKPATDMPSITSTGMTGSATINLTSG